MSPENRSGHDAGGAPEPEFDSPAKGDRPPAPQDKNAHMGAVEGDRPSDDPNQGNENAPGVDAEGMPNDPVGTAQDRIGANLDESEGG